MISPYTIQTHLMSIISDLVGYRLSQIQAGNGLTRPACIRSGGYDTGTQSAINEPPFPYIAVDFTASSRWGRTDIINEYLNEDDIPVIETDIILSYDVKCHGLSKDDTSMIMHELQRKLDLNSVRARIMQDTSSRLFETSDVRKFAVRRQSNIVEVNRMVVDLAIRDVLIDPAAGVFNTIQIDTIESGGGLYESPDDTTPLPIQVEAP